jgi:hypothetical protein
MVIDGAITLQGSYNWTRGAAKNSEDLNLINSAAHSRASGIFPASRKARAFAKAWLSDRRSAADSFPDRAPRALRAAAGVLRICEWSNGFGGRQISTVNGSIATSIRAGRLPAPPPPRTLEQIEAARADRSRTRGREGGCRREVAPPPTRRAGPRPAHAATNRPPLDLVAYRAGLADPSRPGADL